MTCVGTQTSKAPTRVTLLFINYSMLPPPNGCAVRATGSTEIESKVHCTPGQKPHNLLSVIIHLFINVLEQIHFYHNSRERLYYILNLLIWKIYHFLPNKDFEPKTGEKLER